MAGDSAETCSDIIISRIGRITPKKTIEVELNSDDDSLKECDQKSESLEDYTDFEKSLYDEIIKFLNVNKDNYSDKESLKDDIIDYVYDILNLDSVAQSYEYESIIDKAISDSKIFEQEINEMTVSNSNPIVKDRGEDQKCYVTAYELTPIPDQGKDYYEEERQDNTQTRAIYLGNSSSATPSSFYLIPLDNGNGDTDEFFSFNTFVRAETDNGGYISGNSSKPAELSIGVTAPKSLTARIPDPYDSMVAALKNPEMLDYLGIKSDDSKKDLDDKDLIRSFTGVLGVLRTEPGSRKKRIK